MNQTPYGIDGRVLKEGMSAGQDMTRLSSIFSLSIWCLRKHRTRDRRVPAGSATAKINGENRRQVVSGSRGWGRQANVAGTETCVETEEDRPSHCKGVVGP